LETVINGKTGVFFKNQTADELNRAIAISEEIEYKQSDFQKNINRFTEEKFINEIRKEVDLLIRRKSL
ncbi:MAG: glycosyltransferase family 4 protein, partial [Leptospira sp.]|nr:glycosyltransferase family 4 protein [Leptospira sp.]